MTPNATTASTLMALRGCAGARTCGCCARLRCVAPCRGQAKSGAHFPRKASAEFYRLSPTRCLHGRGLPREKGSRPSFAVVEAPEPFQLGDLFAALTHCRSDESPRRCSRLSPASASLRCFETRNAMAAALVPPLGIPAEQRQSRSQSLLLGFSLPWQPIPRNP